MELINTYTSDSEDEITTNINTNSMNLDNIMQDYSDKLKHRNDIARRYLTQDVDISDLLKTQEDEIKLNHYTTVLNNNKVNNIKNYVTGKLEIQNINPVHFDTHMYGFNKTQWEMNDNNSSNIDEIVMKNPYLDDLKQNESANKAYFANQSKTAKDYAKNLKRNREKYGDPGTGDFRGPWAPYKGEEAFKHTGDLSEEQRNLLSQMEEDRNRKIGESKEVIKKKNTTVSTIKLNVNFYCIV